MIGYYCNVESWMGSCTTQSLGKLILFTRYHGKYEYLMYMDTVQIPATKWQQYRFNNATIQGSEIKPAASSFAATRTTKTGIVTCSKERSRKQNSVKLWWYSDSHNYQLLLSICHMVKVKLFWKQFATNTADILANTFVIIFNTRKNFLEFF